MPLADGIYIITNVKQRNLLFLENPDDCTPLQGHYRKNDPGEQWHVIDRGNGQHSIWNVDYKRYANCGPLAELGGYVEGRSREQLWLVQERSKGNYTIAATDTGNLWMLPYDEPGTPVKLFDKSTDERCWWSFTNPETEAPVNEDATDEYLLFELKLLPILPFSPLKMDFIIIQEVSEDSVSTASRMIGEMCGPLVSSRRLRPDALCANIIEIRAPSSNKVFFQRFSGSITFEMVRNLEGPDVPWKRCGGSSLPEIAIRGLRADATKVAILKLNFALPEHGGRAIITLIQRLVERDITLILTPIQPIWRNIFYNGHVFQELEKLSSESRLFEIKDGFSDYVVDYDDAVALPRLAEHPGLRDEFCPGIPHIIEVIKSENREAQLAAVAALSQLAEHAELHDAIFEAMVEVVRMLKDENYDARSSTAAILSKLVECAQLHDMIFQAVLKIIEMHKHDSGSVYLFDYVKHHRVGGIFRDDSGRTALSWAAQRGYDAVVRLLLIQKGVEVNAKNEDGWTPLSWAAIYGHDEVVTLLLAHEGVDVDSRDKRGQTPLLWAAKNGRDAVVRVLLAQEGVDVDSKDKRGQTPLWWAAENGHDEVVALLLAQEGVDADSKDQDGRTPLSWAAGKGHDEVVRLLLAQEGVGADSKDKHGLAPLSWAARSGRDVVVRVLLAQEGVDADSKDKDGRTPLSWAAGKGHDEVVRLLLAQEGVDADSKDKHGLAPLSWAAKNGRDAVVRVLLAQEGVDVDSKDINGQTPLSWAAENGRDAVVRVLLAQEGVDVDSKDISGQTPLSWAARSGRDAVVRVLLAQEGVDAGSKDINGQTPLSWAAENGRDAVVRVLLAQEGVDVDSKDISGQTPLSWAAKNERDAVVRLLLAHGAVGTRRKNW